MARDTGAAGIPVRTGCFRNPGAGEGAFGLTREHVVGAGPGAPPHPVDGPEGPLTAG